MKSNLFLFVPGRWAVIMGPSAPKLLKPSNLKVIDSIDPMLSQNLVEVLGEDLFLRICHFLPAVPLIRTSFGNRNLRSLLENVSVWKSLCYSLLDEAVITLHLKAYDGVGEPGYKFWKTFFRAAWTASGFFYEHRLRERCLHSSECFQQALESGNEAGTQPGIQCIDGAVYFQMRQKVLGSSGHTASALKSYVVAIGGWRPWSSSNDLHVTVLDLKRMTLIEPAVAGPEKPERRLRHSSCMVRDFQGHDECILVLGGCNDKSHVPCAGLQTLLFLTLEEAEGSPGGRLQIRWRKAEATGQVPSAIWHHAADSFSKGTQVIVYGGDIPPRDPEFTFIGDRAYANYVYVLDVNARRWERVQTQGQIPHWRSLHFGATFSQNSAEHFVIMGGCEEHLEIFHGGAPATMLGYSLNLQTFRWRRGTKGKGRDHFLPAPRMRFGAQRYGRHFLVYGGHGEDAIPEDEELLVLNSETLEWHRAEVSNEPSEFGVAPAAALAGGCVLGGVQLGPRGAYPVPKLDFICLDPFGDV